MTAAAVQRGDDSDSGQVTDLSESVRLTESLAGKAAAAWLASLGASD